MDAEDVVAAAAARKMGEKAMSSKPCPAEEEEEEEEEEAGADEVDAERVAGEKEPTLATPRWPPTRPVLEWSKMRGQKET